MSDCKVIAIVEDAIDCTDVEIDIIMQEYFENVMK